jgi:hypothetical protein
MSTLPGTHKHHLIAVCVALLLLVGVLPAAAQQPQPPSVDTNCPFVLKSGIPFGWLRFAPSSAAHYGITIYPGQTVSANTPAQLSWDGVQWWLYVWTNTPNVHGYYWIELGSLVSQCAQPTPTPQPPPGSGAANWQQGNVVRVKAGVPFVWFRAQPFPGNAPIHTVFRGVDLVVMGGPSQDSYGQWWWLVRDPRYSVLGWIEQNSVDLAGGSPSPAPIGWKAGDTVRVRLNLPFSWLRSTPGSHAAAIYTVGPGQTLYLADGPLSDNVQNWWRVTLPYSGISGWVEEASLELIHRA